MGAETIEKIIYIVAFIIFLVVRYRVIKKIDQQNYNGKEFLWITTFAYLCYKYAIKTAFWLTFVLNFPFTLVGSDWTKFTKILLDWK